jgi:cell division initiation protein
VSELRITPLDIRQQEFKKCMRGFDPHEVQAFLEMVADEMEFLSKENSDLFHKLKETEGKLEESSKLEKTLQQTLTSVQKATDQLKKNAQKEADLQIDQAKVEAKKIVQESQAKMNGLASQMRVLESHKRTFVAKFRSLLLSQLRLLDQEESEGVKKVQLASSVDKEKEKDLAPVVEQDERNEA